MVECGCMESNCIQGVYTVYSSADMCDAYRARTIIVENFLEFVPVRKGATVKETGEMHYTV